MIPNQRIDVIVNGAVCNGRNGTFAALMNSNVILSPPPIRNAPIVVIYKHRGQPFKESFVGDGFTTVFKLAHRPDE